MIIAKCFDRNFFLVKCCKNIPCIYNLSIHKAKDDQYLCERTISGFLSV